MFKTNDVPIDVRNLSTIASAFALANYLLFVHFLISILITVMIWKLHGWRVRQETSELLYADMKNLYERQGLHARITIGTVNTIIKSALVVVRIVTTSWTSTVAWRSAFLLMEKGNVDLRQLNFTVSWKLFRPAAFRNFIGDTYRILSENRTVGSAKANTYRLHGLCVTAILLMMWPATFSAPLLTSAIEWLPASTFGTEELFYDIHGTGRNIPLYSWKPLLRESMLTDLRHTDQVLNNFIISMALNRSILHMDYCRHALPGEVLIMNPRDYDTFPCIEINEIQWSKDPTYINNIRSRLPGCDNSRGDFYTPFSIPGIGTFIIFNYGFPKVHDLSTYFDISDIRRKSPSEGIPDSNKDIIARGCSLLLPK